MIDTASGPVREFTITGARLSNVSIDTAHMNMHRTVIRKQQFGVSLYVSRRGGDPRRIVQAADDRWRTHAR